jgi:NADPH-dependent 2,4-dienoyl-CoA reductase/sulfur reductase-like enzyme
MSYLEVDVAVVGAGPAGLAAATTVASSGLSVAVVDAGIQPGGQYWRHPDENHPRGDEGQGHHDWQVFTGLRERFRAFADQGGLHYLPGRQVWFIQRPAESGEPYVLRLVGVNDAGVGADSEAAVGPTQVRARSLVLCPGGYDRELPIPGWDLPGCLAAGGVQALLKGQRSLAGKRAVVAGTGPFLLPVATGLVQAGADVVEICEAGAVSSWVRHLGGAVQVAAKGLEAAGYAWQLIRHRIPYHTRTAVVAIHGDEEVQAVTIARLDANGRVVAGTSRRADVDLVALGWGFTPSLELVVAVGAETRLDVDQSLVASVDGLQRSSVAAVYVAGEATGVGGARLAVLEGELAGNAVAVDRGLPVRTRRLGQLKRAIGRSRAFARSMHLSHPVPRHWADWLTPGTTVCRCEEVSYDQICQARDVLGAHDARTVKLLARPGMGWCQGRVCGFATATLAAADSGRALDADDLRPIAKRPLCAPISLGALAALAAPEKD